MTNPGATHTRADSAPGLPWPERVLLLAALGAIIGAAWVYVVRDARSMDSLMSMAASMESHPRDAIDFGYLFVMWAVMMAAMMLPSATPAVLVYAAVVRRYVAAARGVVWIAAFVSGYALAWCVFSVMAAALQVWLERIALLSPAMVGTSPVVAVLLIASAGIYQLSPIKDVCLHHCRAPVDFVARYWRPGAWGALRMGSLHGAYCVGCCWVLMGLLFVGGVMNVLWLAAIAAFVILEKVAFIGSPVGRRVIGWSLIVVAAVPLLAGI